MAQRHRKDQIIEMVTREGYVSIDDLVTAFNVTPQTIRRDLNQLAEEGLLDRHHGGAGILSSTRNTTYQARKELEMDGKRLIGRMVADDIPDGASLFINIGTTTEAVAHELLAKNNLRIVTNNLHVASILAEREDFRVIVTGGEVRHRDGGIIGEATVDLVKQFQMDFAIIGVSGIHEDGTLLDFDYREVKVAQAIMENSRRVILCADHTKFGRNAMVRLGTVSQIDDLYTDQRLQGPISDELSASGVAVHYPDI